MELRTKRLRMRPVTLADVDDIHQLLVDPGVRRYLCDDLIFPRQRVYELVEASVQEWSRHGLGLYLARPAKSHDCIGISGLRGFGEEGHWELMYAFYPAWWGQGLAVEASSAVLNVGFRKLEKIAARTDPPNTASIRVMEKLGMRYAGEATENGRPVVSYWMTRKEWNEQANPLKRAARWFS